MRVLLLVTRERRHLGGSMIVIVREETPWSVA